MYKLVPISKENTLNKLVKDQRQQGTELNILYVSNWDQVCDNLMEALVDADELIESHPDKDRAKTLHVVNSFDTPHSFVIWNTNRVPELVQVKGRGGSKSVRITSHVSDIYKRLKVV